MMSAEDASNAKQKLGGAIIDGRKIEVRNFRINVSVYFVCLLACLNGSHVLHCAIGVSYCKQ